MDNAFRELFIHQFLWVSLTVPEYCVEALDMDDTELVAHAL
jgi:hypothetical protein